MAVPVKIMYKSDLRRLSVETSINFSLFCDIIQKILPAFSPQTHQLKYLDEEEDQVAITSTVELSEALRAAQQKGQPLKLKVVELENVPLKETTLKCEEKKSVSPSVVAPPSLSYSFDFEQGLQQATEKINGLAKSAESLIPLLQKTVEPALLQAKTYSNEQLAVLAASLKEIKDPAVQQLSSLLRNLSTKIEGISTNETVHSAWCDKCKKQITGIRYKCGNCPDFDLCESCEALRFHPEEHIMLKITKPITYKEMKPLLPSLYAAPSHSLSGKSEVNQEPLASFDAEFICDETVKEGTVFAPDTGFVKIWSMKNTGSQPWPEGSRLLLISGPTMGTKGDVPLKKCAKVGETIDIVVDMIAPTNVGHYTSHWRLCTPDGRKFGHRIWVDIRVDNTTNNNNTNAKTSEPIVKPTTTTAVVPVPIPPKQSLEEEKYAAPLASLAELGFTNKSLNLELIKKHNGDLVAIVTALLDQH